MQVIDRYFEDLFPIVMSNCGSPGNHKICILFMSTEEELRSLKVSELSITELNRWKLYIRSSILSCFYSVFDLMLQKELGQGSEESKIEAAVGFRHIVDAVVSSQKPLIGHNCALGNSLVHF